ncbi:NADP-dependent oxidoreductase [Fulvivirga sediminis]|uniref:NADP-dependent oxidoreductase n=1 Tax=Fulvivirga sediminis TaxID=2803949 RepID=A0A937JYC1_9BACT|nr:NADP-dependent oxidoreductase [Fulvivirga sediminis]MBL3655524.1 NADP-dependent oxidoreductase [Fulvivirga sediminis]
MKAIVIEKGGGIEELKIKDIEKPSIQRGEVLIKVKALSINPVDVKTRQGKAFYGELENEDPIILGWDVAGTVEEVGADVTKFKKGDAVFGMVNFLGHGKAYAEYVASPADHLALKPENISFEEAAASTLAALTAYQDLVHQADLQAGQKVLVHAASGGVGHYAVQIAKSMGAHVIATSSARNKDFVLELGADQHIDYNAQDFEEVVSDVDLVIEIVGGDHIKRSLEVIKKGGTLVSNLGFNDEAAAIAKEKGVKGMGYLVQSNGEDMDKLADLLASGKVKAHVSKTYSFEQLGDAHLQIETGHTRGKVVVTLD